MALPQKTPWAAAFSSGHAGSASFAGSAGFASDSAGHNTDYLSADNSPDPQHTPRGTSSRTGADWTLGFSNQSSAHQALTARSPAEPKFSQQSSLSQQSGSPLQANQSELLDSLGQLARLMANVTDSYTAAIFLCDSALRISSSVTANSIGSAANSAALSNQANKQQRPEALELVAFHTLSRDIIPHCRIAIGSTSNTGSNTGVQTSATGSGLIGWTAENRVRISVCPFEHDASTLLFYSCDQALKSFIALPILDAEENLLGVLSCDSKKSYAFAKVTEKVLLDCASHIAHLVSLHARLRQKKSMFTETKESAKRYNEELSQFLDRLRGISSEEHLLFEAANLPQDLVERDALVIVTSPQGLSDRGVSTRSVSTHNASSPGGSFGLSGNSFSGGAYKATADNRRQGATEMPYADGSGIFPSPTNQARVNSRLMELVCRHKRVLCSDRNVHAPSLDDKLERSFLSIPFRVMNREAGSINVLSPAFASFSSEEVHILEALAQNLGRELELRRLRERFVTQEEHSGLLPWSLFRQLAIRQLDTNSRSRTASTLVRLRLTNPSFLEARLGVSGAQEVIRQVFRLIDQVKGSAGIGTFLQGTECLLLLDGQNVDRILSRLTLLIDRLEVPQLSGGPKALIGLREEIKRCLLSAWVSAPQDGAPQDASTLDELVAKSLRLLQNRPEGSSAPIGKPVSTSVVEDSSNAFRW